MALLCAYISTRKCLRLYISEGSPQPGGLPARYVIKFMIVVGFVLLLLQGVSMIVNFWIFFH